MLEHIARASPIQNRPPDLLSAPVPGTKQGAPESLVIFMDCHTTAASWDSEAIFLEVRVDQRRTRHSFTRSLTRSDISMLRCCRAVSSIRLRFKMDPVTRRSLRVLLLFSASMILLPIIGFFVTKNIIEGTELECRVGSRKVRPECDKRVRTWHTVLSA